MGLRERGNGVHKRENGVRTVIVAIVDGVKSLDVGPRAGFHINGPKVFLHRGMALAATFEAHFEPPHRCERAKQQEADSGPARTFSGFDAKPRAGNPRLIGGLLAKARACDAEKAQARGPATRLGWNAGRRRGVKAARQRTPPARAGTLDIQRARKKISEKKIFASLDASWSLYETHLSMHFILYFFEKKHIRNFVRGFCR